MLLPPTLLPSLALPTPTAPASDTPCDRTFLNDITAAYLAAQTLGAPWLLPTLAPNLTYTEQFKPLSITAGILSAPLNISSHRSFYDDVRCTAFTQYVVAGGARPCVVGTRFEGDGMVLTKIETLVEDGGVDVRGYEYWDSREDWSEIVQEERDAREVIQAAGDAYFDRLAGGNGSVPWGTPCARLEGGAYYTGRGNESANTCGEGLPSGVRVVDRRYVVDQVNGVVVIYVGFPGLDWENPDPTPDSHAFRVEAGKIRYIHTLSTCEGRPGCGLNGTGPPPVGRGRQ